MRVKLVCEHVKHAPGAIACRTFEVARKSGGSVYGLACLPCAALIGGGTPPAVYELPGEGFEVPEGAGPAPRSGTA